jgi:hypothetical protein
LCISLSSVSYALAIQLLSVNWHEILITVWHNQVCCCCRSRIGWRTSPVWLLYEVWWSLPIFYTIAMLQEQPSFQILEAEQKIYELFNFM